MTTPIDAIRERILCITGAPWRKLDDGRVTDQRGFYLIAECPPIGRRGAHADFIANAPEDVATLLGALERAEQERDEARAELTTRYEWQGRPEVADIDAPADRPGYVLDCHTFVVECWEQEHALALQGVHDDREALRAEMARLRAEVERLTPAPETAALLQATATGSDLDRLRTGRAWVDVGCPNLPTEDGHTEPDAPSDGPEPLETP